MQNSSKAWMVLVGCFGFFGLAIFGPALGNAGDLALRTVVQAASGQSPAKYAKSKNYAKSPAMQLAMDCCAGCGMEWQFEQDRCRLTSTTATSCLSACGDSKR